MWATCRFEEECRGELLDLVGLVLLGVGTGFGARGVRWLRSSSSILFWLSASYGVFWVESEAFESSLGFQI